MTRGRATLLTLAIALAIFAAWGLHTESGAQAFDEMAGMIPFAAALLSGLLLAMLALNWAWHFLRRR